MPFICQKRNLKIGLQMNFWFFLNGMDLPKSKIERTWASPQTGGHFLVTQVTCMSLK